MPKRVLVTPQKGPISSKLKETTAAHHIQSQVSERLMVADTNLLSGTSGQLFLHIQGTLFCALKNTFMKFLLKGVNS